MGVPVLRLIQKAWDEFPASLVGKPLKFCKILGALDGTEDDVVWEGQKVTRSLRTNLRQTDSESDV